MMIRSKLVYPCVFLVAIFAWFALIVFCGSVGRDHFAAIRAGRGATWYQDLGGDSVTEIQDQDIFFHNIGASIKRLKQADIVIVGSSLVAFAIDGTIARSELGDKSGLNFYNMSFVGISSGEFTKRIIQKFNIHPKLWIINADDGGGGGNFFGRGVQRSFSGDVKTITATEHGAITAYKEVARRNLRWRMEALFKGLFNSSNLEDPTRVLIPRFFRDSFTGNYDMNFFPRYNSPSNPPLLITRDPNCHTTKEVIDIARSFVNSIGGDVVLTVIPNTYYCAQQAKEIANALSIELVLTGKLNYSTWDGGGHYDRRGSIEFTNDLLDQLGKTKTFARIKNASREARND
jgi:hypothetical protein